MNLSVTNIIVIITCLISYQAFSNRELFNNLKNHPYIEKRNKEWYRFLTSGFIHKDMNHLIFNMITLYSLGNYFEYELTSHFNLTSGNKATGGMIYTAIYLLALIVSHIPSYIKHKDNPGYSSIGASGAVAAVVFANVMFNPWGYLYLFFVIPLPFVVAAVAYVAYSSWASKNKNDNIGHDAHLYGALFGIVFTIIAIPASKAIFLNKFMMGPTLPSFPSF